MSFKNNDIARNLSVIYLSMNEKRLRKIVPCMKCDNTVRNQNVILSHTHIVFDEDVCVCVCAMPSFGVSLNFTNGISTC